MARNGYLAEDGVRLVTVEDDDQLIATAAAAFFAARSAAAADGVALWIVEPAGAYRSYAIQYGMYYYPERYNLNPKNSLKGAAPGYSTHGWGNRIDVNAAALNWMIANGARFGWTREFGAVDPNHFKHDGRTAVSGAGSSGGGVPIPRKDNDMPALIKRNTTPPEWSLIHPALRGPSELERGYIVTADPVRAIWWARFYAEGSGSEDSFARDDYVAAQASARLDATAWPVSGGGTVPTGLATKADVDAAVASIQFPTKVTLPEGTLS